MALWYGKLGFMEKPKRRRQGRGGDKKSTKTADPNSTIIEVILMRNFGYLDTLRA